IGGTGYLQNPNEIGHGYEDKGVTVTYPKKAKNLTWHFVAPMVHDFTWAADTEYNHDIYDGPNGVKLHFLYLDNPQFNDNWKKLQPVTAQLMDFYNKTVGDYPYKQYSVIQGGDGGMEYGMCTLILGTGKLDGLIGVTMHEMAHSWFQFVLATNESKNAWMDEGFTSWLEGLGEDMLASQKQANPFSSSYRAYNSLANSGKEQPLSTHADRYDENRVYSIGAYVKGCLFLSQLEYVIGRDNLRKAVKNYYRDFKFKHPTPNDIKREAEKASGAILDWYLVDWTQTTNTIDYGIRSVTENADATVVTLERVGRMPMPIDLIVEFENGKKEYFYVPLRMMSFEKPNPYPELKRTVTNDWAWAMPTHEVKIPIASGKVKLGAAWPGCSAWRT
ncbi:MAG: M1 family peptidase, partial [Proteobacteria bacterium]